MDDSENFQLTGRERVSMQRFHIEAPEEVDKGNRLAVSIRSLGKLQIEWPLYRYEAEPKIRTGNA